MTIQSIQPTDIILVIGAGLMGAGIAQVAATAGHPVKLFDLTEGAASRAITQIGKSLDTLAAKGKIQPDQVARVLARLEPVVSLEAAADVRLAIEAIVECLEAKKSLLGNLEGALGPQAILASNTSSISITALAKGMKVPGRLVGMHFFNPVPAMKLVEVVSGVQTSRDTADAVFELAKTWGKVPVHAASTPGFIVNRIARPYYAETLMLLQERAGTPAELDACLRAAGFRMGPCELMDLIGHDTNFAVTRSVFEANHGDKRFAPSTVQKELVDGGLLGRKVGRGFYDSSAPQDPVVKVPSPDQVAGLHMVLRGTGPFADRWAKGLQHEGAKLTREAIGGAVVLEVNGGVLRLTDGRPATQVAAEVRRQDVAVFDLPLIDVAPSGSSLAWSHARTASESWVALVPALLACADVTAVLLEDAPGLVVARTIAMLVNEACDAVHQGVCTPDAADAAMRLGVNYPAGPFEWLAAVGPQAVVSLLHRLDAHYRGERYRVSPELLQRSWVAQMRS